MVLRGTVFLIGMNSEAGVLSADDLVVVPQAAPSGRRVRYIEIMAGAEASDCATGVRRGDSSIADGLFGGVQFGK
jgi:hypothetical protein